ncbi:MAG TPA: TetR family transcriptional regulator [Acidimicrobiia bacterium]|jgi:AcrR family transcriptional regulator
MAEPDAKSRLYEAALDLMGRKGIEATSTREILGAVGIKNPSAISYHFGSKAGLVDAMAAELASGQYPILGRQTALAGGLEMPTATEWVAPVVDTAIELAASERGCLLARVWWEFDGYLRPQSLEGFVSSANPIAVAWRDAIACVFPHLPPQIGLARNITFLRTVGWMLARMAQINLASDPFIVRKHTRFRLWLEEIGVTLLSSPTHLVDEDVRGPDIR